MNKLVLLALCLAALPAAGCGATVQQARRAEPPAAVGRAERSAPPAPGQSVRLTSSMQQVRLMAQLSDAYNRDDLRAAYRLLQMLDRQAEVLKPYAERLAALQLDLVERWSQQLLAQARADADQHRFTAAVTRLEEVPVESTHVAEARQLQDEVRQREESFLRDKEAAAERRDRRGAELLQAALRQGKLLDFGSAIHVLRQVPAGSAAYETAQVKLGQYKQLLAQRERWRTGAPPPPAPARHALATTRRPATTAPARPRPVNWEQWRFKQWQAQHRRDRALPSQPPPLLPPRPGLLWPLR